MRKRIPFGALLPDLPPGDQLVTAKNVFPAANGYIPVPSPQPITPALTGIRGGVAYVSSTGETSFIAGTRNGLSRYLSGEWEVLFAGLSVERWRFAQFGDNAIAVNGGAPIRYRLDTGAAALLAGDPPNADLVAVVRDFVVLAGDPANRLTVTWSGSNNSAFWPATDPTNPDQQQSDSQPMLDGGEIMGLAGGEYGIVLQKNAIKRMTYTGGEVIYSFDEISSNIGCMAKGSVAQSGRLVFFLSERGFQVCDGNDVKPIGAERIDRTFFASFGRQDIINGLSAAVDPTRNLVVWSMPGRPGLLWCYNYGVDRWTTVEVDVSLVFSGFTTNVSLGQIDEKYGNVDAVPVSLDDPMFAGGNPLLLIATTAGVVGTPGGSPLPGTLTTSRIDLSADRTRIRTIRPITDANSATVTIQGRPRAGSVPLVEQSSDMRGNGEVPLRVNAQQIVVSTTIRGAWSYALGFDVDYEDGGRR